MNKIFEKLGLGTYLIAVAVVAALVGMIASIVSNSVVGYSIVGIEWVIVCSILAIACCVGAVIISLYDLPSVFVDVCLLLAVVLCGIMFFIVVGSRTELVGTLWITALDSVNPLAVSAMNSATVGFVGYILAMIMVIVGGFCKIKK